MMSLFPSLDNHAFVMTLPLPLFLRSTVIYGSLVVWNNVVISAPLAMRYPVLFVALALEYVLPLSSLRARVLGEAATLEGNWSLSCVCLSGTIVVEISTVSGRPSPIIVPLPSTP